MNASVHLRLILGLGVLLTAATEGLYAQRARLRSGRQSIGPPRVEVGLRGGYDFDVAALLAGVQIRLPLDPTVELVPSADYYFANEQTVWQANLDLSVRTGFLQMLYGGVGGAVAHRSFTRDDFTVPDETKLALNLFAGASTPRLLPWRVRPYVEVRWTSAGNFSTQVALVAGANLRLGGSGAAQPRASPTDK